MTVYIIDIESVESRYTGQWKRHVPTLLREAGNHICVIEGPIDIPAATTPGAFLNFGGTNVYKAKQVEQIGRLFCGGAIKDGDYFLFTDAWHPGIINLRYMAELLGIRIKIGGLWHAGSYDPQDFLGRLVGDAPWVRHAEKSFYHAIDYNFFATKFHIKMFCETLLDFTPADTLCDKKIIQTGWPMEYMADTLKPYKNITKRDLILFPHRIAPEKQVNIFRDLAKKLPQYEFVVCQDKQLSKDEYHNLLGAAKIVFSASLQETLGIGCYEGALVDAIPMVPDRLSYGEMYLEEFKYPSQWTDSYSNYEANKVKLCNHIIHTMTSYEYLLPILTLQTQELSSKFFSCEKLLENIPNDFKNNWHSWTGGQAARSLVVQ